MTQYRLVVLGDLHLTSGPRNADRLAALDYVIGDANLNPVDAWLWPGDLTHSGMTIEIRNALVTRVQRMASIAPVIIVPGNHDPGGDLDFLAKLYAQHLISVVTTPSVIALALGPGRGEHLLSLFCLPYPNKARIVAAGTPSDQVGAVATQAFDAIFMEAGAQLARARAAGQLTGAIGHATIRGAVASTGQPQIGHELEIEETHLARLGPCFKIFNHIHKHQRIGSVMYAGSLCRLDWGEVEPKGYVVIECEPDEHSDDRRSGWGHREAFVEIPVAPMFHVEGTLTRDGLDWRVANDPALVSKNATRLDWDGCDVRVRASYAQQERDVLATARERITQEFATARRLEIELIAVPDRALRAPEVIAAQTLEAKLKAWARLSGVAWSDRIERCADRLENSLDADAVVKDVETRLMPLAELNAANEQIEVLSE